MSPMQRSLKHLRDLGYTVARAEHWDPFGKRRVDLFGFADILALDPGNDGVIAIQTTTKANMAARRKKILSLPAACLWIRCGNTIWLHGWKGKELKDEFLRVPQDGPRTQ